MEPLAQKVKVVYIAVMDDGQLTGAVSVRMGVGDRNTTHGSPAGMTDSQGTFESLHLIPVLFHCADALGDYYPLAVDQSNSERIVAPVSYPLQRAQ
jgi:hypothetical protein